jgi:4-hydroxy-4-methyl-2-oxoglutarate aldolase
MMLGSLGGLYHNQYGLRVPPSFAPILLACSPMYQNTLPKEGLERLRRFDTCTLANAIERLEMRPRSEGFIVGAVRCQYPKLPPVAGYAVTGRIRSSMPPVGGGWYYEQIDWWRYLDTVPSPRIVVMQDSDPFPGTGAFFGEIHARICRALHCVAYVTNGAVRDIPGIQALGFQLFAGSLSVSHAYCHVVEFGQPIEIGGLRINSGDLLHGDVHGVHQIPAEAIRDLVPAAEQVQQQEQELFHLCDDPDFCVDKLAAKLEEQRHR